MLNSRRMKYIVSGCCVLLLVAGVTLWMKDEDTSAGGGISMGAAIAVLFDENNQNISYDWTLATNSTTGAEELVEVSSFTLDGWTYEFLLSTEKAEPTATDYAVINYLLATVQDTTGTEKISYIDMGADGVVDTALIGDQEVANQDALNEAQTQYTAIMASAYNAVQ